jgi:pimeloyl-ACP methyl ester carboxylesterase
MKNQILIAICLLTAFSFSARADLNNGLVAYYPFNGNANDASGNGNNGVVYDTILTTNRFGTANAAYDFNGSSSYIDIPQNLALNNLTANFTLSAWIYQRSAQPNGYRIIDKCPAGLPDGWTFDTCDNNTGRKVRIQGAANNALNVIGNTEYSLMTWHHVVTTVSGTIGKVYLDGNLDGTGNVGNIPANVLDIFIGRAHPNNGSGETEWFNGIIDDVRIYNRALSDSEIQQLYSSPDIGTAPNPPTVVQTNRTPSNAELGNQGTGVLEILTNGVFTNVTTLDPNKKTIVLTHGWNSSANDWPWEMDETLQVAIGSSTANIVAWNWPTNASSPWIDPWEAGSKTPQEGQALGASLVAALGPNYSQPIHFIGHSFGTLVNAGAADYLQENGYPAANMQMTLFDEAEVGSGSNTTQTAAMTITALLANDSAPKPFWYHPLPTNFAWADNYITAFGLLHPEAANIILTNLYPAPTDFVNVLFDELLNFHAYPMDWYNDSISDPFGSSMGFRWSFEENSLAPPPATNTYFIQTFNGSDLNLETTDFSTANQLLNSRLQKMLTPHEYTLLQTLPGVLQAVNQVEATVQDTLPQDPYVLTTGLPEGWGIDVTLTTSSGGSSQNLARPLGLKANDGSNDNTNLPAYAWIPLSVPSNAVSMSFDFILHGDGASDSFAVALNGTNVFSVAANLIQTNVTLNSGQIDVSQYVGTNVELFLGIVGGTSTNASITANDFRFYSILPPLLQAQASGNNFVLSWPLSAADYNLETSTDLVSWAAVTNISTIVDLQNTVSNGISGGMRFYRLVK